MCNSERLKDFLQRVISDANLTTTHIGVCTALAVAWTSNEFKNPFGISRRRLMNAAKIKSTSTYHRIISDLKSRKYIEYNSSYHPIKGTSIAIL
jgi:hypothetical protein